jgi:hypothetical protein
MKKFIFLLIISQSMIAFGQSPNDSILIGNARGDIKCYQNGFLLNDADYKTIFKDNPYSLNEMRLSRIDHKAAMIFSYAGGFVFGFCLGSLISGDQIDYTWWWTLGSSAAVVGLGLSLDHSCKKHIRNAVGRYNSELRTSGYINQKRLELGLGNNGVSFIFRF